MDTFRFTGAAAGATSRQGLNTRKFTANRPSGLQFTSRFVGPRPNIRAKLRVWRRQVKIFDVYWHFGPAAAEATDRRPRVTKRVNANTLSTRSPKRQISGFDQKKARRPLLLSTFYNGKFSASILPASGAANRVNASTLSTHRQSTAPRLAT